MGRIATRATEQPVAIQLDELVAGPVHQRIQKALHVVGDAERLRIAFEVIKSFLDWMHALTAAAVCASTFPSCWRDVANPGLGGAEK